jgi:group I intron endonuclease
MLIYKITNKINSKIYVGQTSKTIEDRLQRHIKEAKKKRNRYLYDAMNHYGYDNFIIEVIETDVDKNNIDDKETFWIKKLNTLIPNGYNMTKGGGGGNTLEFWDEDRKKELYRKQGDKRRGKRSPEWRESIRQAACLREQSKSEENKNIISNKISKTLKEKYQNGTIEVTIPKPKFGKDNWNHTEVDCEQVLKLIKLQWKMTDIAKKFNTTRATILNKLKQETGKTFVEWRREYGIKGSFGKVQRLDSDQ